MNTDFENPYGSLFQDLLIRAKEQRASDIHIQPERDGVMVRFRVHGELVPFKWIPDVHKVIFLQEAKRLSHCSIGISGRAQDARFSIQELSLDVRVNLIPSLFGEKLVFRLLDQSRQFKMDAIGLELDAKSAIENALQCGDGVCLITGPTGSGKTTLLYSALEALNRQAMNIVTIEDPVEYTFPGITQVQVSPRLTFADSLRAMLRQDPDVILVGEVRDRETAELCFQAASTGHLVLSTLHANNSKEVVRRLQGLGVETDAIKSCLRFSSAQRLLPKICAHCSHTVTDTTLPSSRDLTIAYRKRSQGCGRCERGLIGMVPVVEYIDWTKENSEKEMVTLKELAMNRARKGEIDVYDAIAV
jgi:type II secretory ATPase GspE/PulE/Tfp pilus assembly ATPase PilB-like protein